MHIINKIGKICLTSIFLHLSFFNFYIYAQTIDETTELADEMFKLGDFNNSIVLYKRIIFFSVDNKAEIFIKTGNSYYNIKNYLNAVICYDSALNYISSANEYNDIIFKKADCFIFTEDYEKSLNTIEKVKLEDDKFLKQKHFYKGILYFLSEDFDRSEHFFLQSIDDTSLYKKELTYQLFEKKKHLNSPDPIHAGVLSSILPGAGQLYSGDYNNALNSFMLISFLTLITADFYLRYGLIDALISFVPWLNRYFKGGYENAQRSAEFNRDKKRNEILNEIIELIGKDLN